MQNTGIKQTQSPLSDNTPFMEQALYKVGTSLALAAALGVINKGVSQFHSPADTKPDPTYSDEAIVQKVSPAQNPDFVRTEFIGFTAPRSPIQPNREPVAELATASEKLDQTESETQTSPINVLKYMEWQKPTFTNSVNAEISTEDAGITSTLAQVYLNSKLIEEYPDLNPYRIQVLTYRNNGETIGDQLSGFCPLPSHVVIDEDGRLSMPYLSTTNDNLSEVLVSLCVIQGEEGESPQLAALFLLPPEAP